MRTWLREVTPTALALRATVCLAPVLALLVTGVGGPRPRLLLVVLVVILSLGAGLRPDAPVVAADLGLVIAWWGLAWRHDVPLLVVPAGWLLLLAHLAATVLGHGPRELAPTPALIGRWARRGVLLAVVPAALWLMATAVDGQPEPPGIWVTGLAVTASVCVLAALATRTEDPT